jgi:hypothetical protein
MPAEEGREGAEQRCHRALMKNREQGAGGGGAHYFSSLR